MNQIIPFHYLISMSLDDGLTSVQKASKKRKEKKNYDGKKIRHASTRTPFFHTFSSLFLSFFFNITRFRLWVSFPPFRDLVLGWFFGIYFMVESHKCTGNIHSVYYVVLCLLPNS